MNNQKSREKFIFVACNQSIRSWKLYSSWNLFSRQLDVFCLEDKSGVVNQTFVNFDDSIKGSPSKRKILREERQLFISQAFMRHSHLLENSLTRPLLLVTEISVSRMTFVFCTQIAWWEGVPEICPRIPPKVLKNNLELKGNQVRIYYIT